MHVCVINSSSELRNQIASLLRTQGLQIEAYASVTDMQVNSPKQPQALVLCSSLLESPELFQQLAEALPVIVVADEAQIADAVLAIKLGAINYLAIPFQNLANAIVDAIQERDLKPNETQTVQRILGSSEEIIRLRTLVRKIAPTNTSVLIHGETGCGKDLFAHAIHSASLRSDQPMITVNCDLVPQSMHEDEIFGTNADFGTNAESSDSSNRPGQLKRADHSTLLLNEIADLSLDAQARLVYFLDHGRIKKFGTESHEPVDVRLISTSSHDLYDLVRTGRLRDDLFHRMNRFILRIPPLRERDTDPVTLGRSVLRQVASELGKPNLRLKPNAERKLLRYSWPGNVRELENSIERAALLADGSTIDAELLAIEEYVQIRREEEFAESSSSTLEEYFREFVTTNEDKYTETELAAKLGISRKSLWERRQKLGMPRKRTRIRAVHK